MSLRRAVYAGSFDPLTQGHLWVIDEGRKIFDELIVAIGENPQKKYTFSRTERLDMLQQCIYLLPPVANQAKITIEYFENQYLVDYATQKNANFMLRGIRNSQDFEYEKTLRHINSDINFGNPEITTVYIIPPRELSEVSSSFVKALCGPKNWQQLVSQYVSAPVLKELERINQPRS